jgi:hypothetical protein
VEIKRREFTREELYKLIWEKPATILAKEFGISDVGLAKICKRLGIPRPQRGYWRLVEVGRKPTVPRLPPPRKGDPTLAVIHSQRPRAELAAKDLAVLELITRERMPMNHISVSPDLRGAHSLVRNAKELLEKGYADPYGRMRARRNAGIKQKCLDVRVLKKTLPRALRIMSALLKALEERGYKIEVGENKTQCLIDGELVGFYLWETVKRSEQEPTKEQRDKPSRFEKWVFTSTGELVFVLDEYCMGRRNWKDRKQSPLEDRLNEIVVAMITAAGIKRAQSLQYEQERQRRLEAQRQREEIERQRQLEAERRKELEAMAASWRTSLDLRLFLEECERSLSVSGNLPADGVQPRWLRWAMAHADRLDPLKSGQLYQVIQTHEESIKDEP